METPSYSDNGTSSRSGQETPATQFYSAEQPSLGQNMTIADGKRKRVEFTEDTTPPSFIPNDETSESPTGHLSPQTHEPVSQHSKSSSMSEYQPQGIRRNDVSETELSRSLHQAFGQPYVPKPRPAIRRTARTPDVELSDMSNVPLDSDGNQKHKSGIAAHDRAQKLAARVGSYNVSASTSRRNSYDIEDEDSFGQVSWDESQDHNAQSLGGVHNGDQEEEGLVMKAQKRPRRLSNVNAEIEARRLVRSYTQGHSKTREAETPPLRSGQVTPVEEQYHAEDYVPKPEQYRGGVLASLLKLQNHQGSSIIPGRHRTYSRKSSIDIELLDGTTPSYTPGHSPPGSGATTPTYKHGFLHRHKPRGSESSFSLGHLIASSSTIALPQKGFSEDNADKGRQAKQQRPGLGKRTRSTDAFGAIAKKFSKPHGEEEAKITVHIAETLARQKYLVKLCRALMEYGAPTHRLEEYMRASSRVLAIESQFLYIPGCMIISFDDPSTHTTEVKLVRTAGGVDLGKLRDTHRIYKEVVHDVIGVEEATIELEEVVMQEKKFPVWFLIFVYGIASVSVGPFAFQARLIDLPISFILGCFLGFLQLKVAPRSDLYANIFEIAASVITSFAARGFGSIPDGKGGTIFCFSALAQSSIALILPGYTVLCASLELQSRSIVAGSVRMVYAIIYSLFLGYGITIGTVMYGSIDKNATSATTCTAPMPDFWYFFFVPVFTLCLSIINQAKWKQAPVMLFISFAGYVVNVFSARRFRGNTQVSQTLGALCIGILANLYARLGGRVENFSIEFWNNKLRPLILQTRSKLPSAAERLMRRLQSPKKQAIDEPESEMAKPPRKGRVGFGLAAAAMLPAIFVQVPSGLAVSGSLVAGITSANQILNNATGTTTVSSGDDSITLNSAAFNVGYSVIQVAIGITVGLFLSAVLVYPFGKKRSGLFSF